MTIIICGFGQSNSNDTIKSKHVYCELVGMTKLFSTKITVYVDYDFKTIDDVYRISTTYYNIYNENYFTIEEEYKMYFRSLKLKNLKS
jgi:hypothetical protein